MADGMDRSPSHPESPQPDNGNWNVRTVKEYFERVITDRDVNIKTMIDDRDKALRLAVTELDRRLDNLNHEYSRAKDKERDFYSRAQHDDFAKSQSQQIAQLHDDIESLRRPQWQTWIPAMALVFTIIGGAWYFATQPLQIEIAHQRDRDSAFEETLKKVEITAKERSDNRAKASEDRDAAINTRIDRLYELYRDLQTQHTEALKEMKKK